MKSRNKNWISRITVSTGALTAVVAPVVITIAYQSRTSHTSFSSIDQDVASQVKLYSPSGVPSHFETSLQGFEGVYSSLETLYPEVKYDFTKLDDFYKANTAKANNFIAFVNATLMQRGFWSNLWSGIKHVSTSVVNTVVDVAKTVGNAFATVGTAIAAGVTFGQVPVLNQAVIDSANRTADAAISYFNDAASLIKTFTGLDIKNFSNSDWAKFGTTIFMLVCGTEVKLAQGMIGDFITDLGANTIERKIAEWATRHIIKNTVHDYLNWEKNRMQLEIKLSDVQQYQNLPADIRANLTTGVNYYNDGTTAYQITVI